MFNFDDLPDFEPLEVVLQLLRQPENVERGLDKLLKARICCTVVKPISTLTACV